MYFLLDYLLWLCSTCISNIISRSKFCTDQNNGNTVVNTFWRKKNCCLSLVVKIHKTFLAFNYGINSYCIILESRYV